MLKTRTKIVCTIGPSSWDKNIIKKLAQSGMDVIRMNMAHGTYEEHSRTISRIRTVARELNQPLAIEVDLQGPKIRVGEIAGDGVELRSSQKLVFSTNPKLAKKVASDLSRDKIFIQYPNLHKDVEAGARLLLADGTMGVKVLKVEGHDIVCEVVFRDGEVNESTVRLAASHPTHRVRVESSLRLVASIFSRWFSRSRQLA